jgi:5-aminolevulinic acid synthase
LYRGISKYGFGTGGSRYISGTTPQHHVLEKRIAEFHSKEEGVLYNTGYMANSGTIPVICGEGDQIFSDEANHASIIEGCRLSRAMVTVWKHNDAQDLDEKIALSTTSGKRLIVFESLYSMDGDFAPIAEILEVARKYGCLTYCDEVHAVGVYGSKGAGLAEELGLADQIDVIMAGMAKAFGGLGGYVGTNSILAQIIKSKSKAFIFTVSLPQFMVAAMIECLDIVINASSAREAIHSNATLLKELLREKGIRFVEGASHIVPILTGSPQRTNDACERLIQHGFYVQGVNYPSVPLEAGRLRVTVTAKHKESDIRGLVETLCKVLPDGIEERAADAAGT